jgi:phytoene dehydrogenase-like protein
MSTFDIIVIGGGHNGLTAASMLAKRGKRVLLLEKQGQLGGLAAAGILADTSLVRASILKELSLEKHGLVLMGSRVPIVLLGKKGQELLISGNHTETSDRIAKVSQHDAAAYLKLRAFLDKVSPIIRSLMNETPPNIQNLDMKEVWSLGKKALGLKMLGNETMLEFLRIAPMCVADYLNEWFETDFLKAGLAAPALYGSFTGPWSAGSNLNFLLYECLAQEEVEGGALALTAALAKAAESHGVEVRTNAEVTEVVIENGVAEGVRVGGEVFRASVIMSSCSPKQTMLDRVNPTELNLDTEMQLNGLRSRGTTAIVNITFDQEVRFSKGEEHNALYRTGSSFDEMEKAFDNSKYREYSQHPLMEIRVATDKKAVNIMVHYAPYDLEGGWTDQAKAGLLDNVIRELNQYMNKDAGIVDSEVISPKDIEEYFGIPGGHIYHAEHAIDQLITRPFPSFMQYKTSVPGLYHCGSGAHPGGGLTCAPGYLAASTL